MQVLRQRRVPEDLGLLVLGVVGQREGVVGGGAAEEEEGRVPRVLAGFGIGGGAGLRRCGESAEELRMGMAMDETMGALQN